VPTLDCYGSAEADDGLVRVALEDAGDSGPAFGSPESRSLIAEWAAALHMSGASVPAASLPEAGPQRFALRLADASARLVTRLETEALADKDRAVLERSLEQCRRLSSMWSDIERLCRRYPRTLVHGDLVEENLRFRSTPRGPELVALDWEKVGWGVPAVDLVRVDPDLYWSRAHRWLGGTKAEFEQLVRVGLVFRVFAHRWTQKSIRKARHADARLSRLLDELEG
jgi:aminoglycoside phosphotransferase (APT) family kinase protein